MIALHISLNTGTAHSGCKPSTSMSSSTHFHQVFLFLPLHLILTPATFTFLQADTQSFTLLRSRCPNHLNLPRLTTSATLDIPKRLYKFTLHFLHPSTTLHTSISPSFAPSSPGYADSQPSTPLFQSRMLTDSGPKLCIIFPFMWYDAPRAARIGDNSLNLAQAHLTLALAAFFTPLPAPKV